jgi:hypothetical protein
MDALVLEHHLLLKTEQTLTAEMKDESWRKEFVLD